MTKKTMVEYVSILGNDMGDNDKENYGGVYFILDNLGGTILN